jgi:hypothetical protein
MTAADLMKATNTRLLVERMHRRVDAGHAHATKMTAQREKAAAKEIELEAERQRIAIEMAASRPPDRGPKVVDRSERDRMRENERDRLRASETAVTNILTRLHQLRGLGDAKLLKSLGWSFKGRHYRG